LTCSWNIHITREKERCCEIENACIKEENHVQREPFTEYYIPKQNELFEIARRRFRGS
jgi:hypothetical protein